MSRPSAGQAMVARLRRIDPAIPATAELRRTYASRAMLNAGAWVWSLWVGNRSLGIGSQFPLRELAGPIELTERDQFGERNVDPVVKP